MSGRDPVTLTTVDGDAVQVMPCSVYVLQGKGCAEVYHFRKNEPLLVRGNAATVRGLLDHNAAGVPRCLAG